MYGIISNYHIEIEQVGGGLAPAKYSMWGTLAWRGKNVRANEAIMKKKALGSLVLGIDMLPEDFIRMYLQNWNKKWSIIRSPRLIDLRLTSW